MTQKHFLVSKLEIAEQDPTKDYHLSMVAEHEFTNFFEKGHEEARLKERLATLKDLDLSRSPLFEAIFFFGEWKIEKDYKKGLKSAEKFEEMEKMSYARNWTSLLVYCLETTTHIFKSLGYKAQLKLISKRMCSYLREKKEVLPTHTILELARFFNSIIMNAEESDIDEIYKLLIDFSERRLSDDPFHFQRGFLFEAIKIARFLKAEADEKKLGERVIETWIKEAEFKGRASKLVKFSLLQSALDYSVSIGDKEKVEQLKKELSVTDFSDELKEVSLPEEELKRFDRSVKEHFEKLRNVIRKYVNGLSKLPTLGIILSICNDDSIVRINVKETKKFVRELMRKHPIQNIFGTILDTGGKTIRLDSPEDKEKFRLNEQLLFGVRETIWMVAQIFRELEDRNLLSSFSIEGFLTRCLWTNKNTFELVQIGVHYHFQADYVGSVSILTPLIEGVLFDYLKSIRADVSSYEGRVIEQRELGGLLNQEEVRECFGEDFQYFLKLFLVEADSINFRNRLAHGNMNVNEFNKQVSSIIIFMILKICSKTFKPSI